MNGSEGIKAVFHITDRKDNKSIWTRIGSAFVNKDNSLNVLLDSIPLDGRMHIRDNKPKKKGEYDD